MKNKTISIGICAYNEEKNIKNVLNNILKQKKSRWTLTEILVYCDGCTDNTISILKEMKNKSIKIIDDKKRKGKTARLSEMFKKFSGSILIMFDADIALKGQNVITDLIKPFEDKDVMLAGGNSTPFQPKTFTEKAVFTTFRVFYKSRLYVNGGNNVFGCTGSILAIRKELARSIKMPNIINEDVFIYLFCISKKFKFNYVDGAVVFYKLPTNLGDYVKQVFRSDPRSATIELNKYFGGLAEKEFHRPSKFYFKSIFESFLENPVGLVTIVFVNIFCKTLAPVVIKNYKLEWFTASSTH